MLKPLLLASVLSLVAAPALADTLTATITFSGTDTGTVNLVATSTSTSGVYLLTGISGTTDGSAITGIIPAGQYPNNPGPASDNELFYPAVQGGNLDFLGISYSLADGSDVNIYYVAPAAGVISGYFTDIDNSLPSSSASFSALDLTVQSTTVTPGSVTPEPASLALAGTGIVGLAGMLRRRFVRQA